MESDIYIVRICVQSSAILIDILYVFVSIYKSYQVVIAIDQMSQRTRCFSYIPSCYCIIVTVTSNVVNELMQYI